MFRTKLRMALVALGVFTAAPAVAAGSQGHGTAHDVAPNAVGWKLQHAFHHYFGAPRSVDRHLKQHIHHKHYWSHRRHHWQRRHHGGHWWGPQARWHYRHAWRHWYGAPHRGGYYWYPPHRGRGHHHGKGYRDDYYDDRDDRRGRRGRGWRDD